MLATGDGADLRDTGSIAFAIFNFVHPSVKLFFFFPKSKAELMQTRPLLIVNPTKFLGNFLISFGAIQKAINQFELEGQAYKLLIDAKFKPIVQGCTDPNSVIFYPREKMREANPLKRLALYVGFLVQLRMVNAAIAVDMEGDSVSSILTLLSGAKTTVGPFGSPRSTWYKRLSQPKCHSEQSEFYKYRNVLQAVSDFDLNCPFYGRLEVPTFNEEFALRLEKNCISTHAKLVVLHTGASKERKFWPQQHWVALIEMLRDYNVTPVLIGRGETEAENNIAIAANLRQPIADLTNKLSLIELTQLISMSGFFIGNDSGPMHLASALGVNGIGIFGPTYENLWGPLLPNVSVLRSRHCPPACNNGHRCQTNISCLTLLKPDVVFKEYLLRCQLPPIEQTIPSFNQQTIELQPAQVGGQRDTVHSTDHSRLRSAAP